MLTPIDAVILFGVLYVIHSSFRQVNMMGFVTTFAIAIAINYYMVNYLNISFVIGLLLVVVLSPIIQILLKMTIKGTALEPRPPPQQPSQPETTTPQSQRVGGPDVDPLTYLPKEIGEIADDFGGRLPQ